MSRAALFLPSILVFAMHAHGGTVDFSRDIQPILSENCYHCHGPDANDRKGDLRLDVPDGPDGAYRTLDGITAIKPGDSASSEAILRILSEDEDEVMPPPKSHRTLTAQQKELLKRWVDEGAPWGTHWAFQKPTRPPVPRIEGEAHGQQNPIDAFIRKRLAKEGLAPSLRAEPERLIRRLSLDLNGIPPSPEQVQAFVAEYRADPKRALDNLLDRLFASPRYGERMVWEWLDAARYADTNGYQGDPTRAMWYWRDWAIRAFNENKPYDQFTIEQLAGDLLPEPTQDQLIATGFHRNHMINGEGGRIPEESRVEYVMDRTETTGTVWLGLTFNCCRCHDHKYDQLSQREYYALSAYFNSIDESGANDAGGYAKPVLSLASPEEQKEIANLKAAEADAAKHRDELEKQLRAEQSAWEETLQQGGSLAGEVKWQVLSPEEATSEKGAKLTTEPDGTIFVSGENADTDDLVVIALTQMRGATALRLEVLPDERLPKKGAGRAENGSWVLSEFKFLGDGKPISLAAVRASFEQPGWPLANALDGKDDTGWGAWPHVDRAQEAVFEIQTDFGYRLDKMLSFRLQFRSQYKQHVIGKFRLSITDAPRPYLRPMPDNVTAALAIAPSQRSSEQGKAVTDFYLASESRLIAARKAAEDAKAAREAAEKAAPRTMVMRERDKARDTFILQTGLYDKYSDKVAHGVPAVLNPLPADAPPNRLSLAKWIVADDNPLTARVTVNRFWQQFFGIGLVKTTEDFGVQGEKPWHPELLDWLAREFIESGWNLKHLIRLIVSSETYMQSSRIPPGMAERDPENRLLARGPRHRLPSWMLRDQALAVSGLLVDKLGGPPVKTYQPAGVWEDATFGQIKFSQDHGEALYRRSLYIFWRRIVGPTVLFDVANRQICSVKTDRTNTPLHALVTLNDITYVEAARAMAERLLKAGDLCDDGRIQLGFRLCTAREPKDSEKALLSRSLARWREHYLADPEAAKALIHTGESKPDATLPDAELAAHTSLALLLLNLDETLSKE